MKRFLSLCLVAFMIAMVLPISIAGAEKTGWEESVPYYRYSFEASAFNLSSNVSPDASSHSIKAMEKLIESGVNTGSDPWGFLFSSGHASITLQTNALRHSSYLRYAGDVNAQAADGGKVAPYDPSKAEPIRLVLLEIKVKEGGTFRPVVEALGDKNNCKMDVYLINQEGKEAPTSASDARKFIRNCGEENRLGIVDLYSEVSEEIERSLPVRSLKAGTYWLAFVYNGSNENCVFNYVSKETHNYYGYYYPYNEITGFRLDGVNRTDEAVELEYVISSSPDVINYEETALTDTSDDLMNWTNTASDDSTETGRSKYDGAWKRGSAQHSIYNLLATKTRYLNKSATAPWRVVQVNKADAHSKGFNNEYIDVEGRFGNAKAGAGNLTDDGTLWSTKTNASTGKAATNNFTKESDYPYYAFEITVPYEGIYSLYAKGYKYASGAVANMYFVEKDIVEGDYILRDEYKEGKLAGQYSFYDASLKDSGSGYNIAFDGYDYELVGGDICIDKAGSYYLVVELVPNEDETRWQNTDNQLYYMHKLISLKLTKTGETPKAIADAAFDEEVLAEKNVNVKNATPVSREEESVTISALAADVEGKAVDADAEASGTPTVGCEYTVRATDAEGYTFLYWAKGIGENKRFVSSDKEYTFKPTAGRNILTAIYRKNNSEKTVVVFYNGNGEEISRRLYNAGDEITIPALPSMAGFGDASAWTLAGKETDFAAGDKAMADGSAMSFVAKYGDVINVEVTTNGTASETNPAYGDDVTVTASLRDASGENVFAYWEKDGEIVSFNTSYTFKAWKNTTVNAIYKKYQPFAATIRKIIMSSFSVGNDDAVMAEFILPDTNVIEKGVIFGEDLDHAPYRAAMSGDGNYFSIIDDVTESPVGYAILSDGSVIYSK